MESNPATKLQKKKINKGKLKKTIKNVLCRPDTVFWPSITEDQQKVILAIVKKHKVAMPEFKKLHWKDIKLLPKEERPKPPKIEKIEGLIFGIAECSIAIKDNTCSAITIEAAVNPRTIVQTVLELCVGHRVPAICVEGLRKATADNFGIPTSCLGVKKDNLAELSRAIIEIGASKLPAVETQATVKQNDVEMVCDKEKAMDVDSPHFQYLHRTNKKSRAFVPPTSELAQNKTKQFVGQDFIEFSSGSNSNPKTAFKKMVVKRVSNNPNRVKVK